MKRIWFFAILLTVVCITSGATGMVVTPIISGVLGLYFTARGISAT